MHRQQRKTQHHWRGCARKYQPPDRLHIQLYDDSNILSQFILDAYCDATGFENRGVTYADNMTGINWSTIPVTIVEMGFMTNESDDLKMSDPDFQDTMASGIADGIDAYFAEK